MAITGGITTIPCKLWLTAFDLRRVAEGGKALGELEKKVVDRYMRFRRSRVAEFYATGNVAAGSFNVRDHDEHAVRLARVLMRFHSPL